MERQSKESRGLEAHCRGGQGPPRAVAPSGREVMLINMNTKFKMFHVATEQVMTDDKIQKKH
jgi:hypothetical protein